MVPFVGLNGVVSDCAEHLVVVLVFEGPALAHQRVVEHVQAACVEAAGRDDLARHGHSEVGCVALPVQGGGSRKPVPTRFSRNSISLRMNLASDNI